MKAVVPLEQRPALGQPYVSLANVNCGPDWKRAAPDDISLRSIIAGELGRSAVWQSQEVIPFLTIPRIDRSRKDGSPMSAHRSHRTDTCPSKRGAEARRVGEPRLLSRL